MMPSRSACAWRLVLAVLVLLGATTLSPHGVVGAQTAEAVVATGGVGDSMMEAAPDTPQEQQQQQKQTNDNDTSESCTADQSTETTTTTTTENDDASTTQEEEEEEEEEDFAPLYEIMEEEYSYEDIWDDQDCDDYFETAERPSNHTPVWNRLRQLYLDTMKIPPESPTYITMKTVPSAIQIPYQVQSAGVKGLGLFALADAPKGALLDDAGRGGRAIFHQGDDFRRFVAHTTSQADRCLILQCAGVESDAWNAPDHDTIMEGAFITVDLDDSCFMNGESFEGEANTGWPFDKQQIPTERELLEDHGGCTSPYCAWALKDVKVGDELITPYEEYTFSGGWEHFDL